MAVKRICPKCKRPSYSANAKDVMKCPYKGCGADVPPPKAKP